MKDTAFIPIGRVVKPHGLTGEVSVRFDCPIESLPDDLHVWFVPPPVSLRDARIVAIRQGPKGPLVTFDRITSIEAADALRGTMVMARPEDLPPSVTAEDPSELGYAVVDDERGHLGRVTEIILTGANDVWVVDGTELGQVLIPVIDECVLSVDHDARTVRVKLLPGLIEESS